MANRKPRAAKTYPDVDLTVPIKKENFIMADGDCFGKQWDMTTSQCPQCADRDICSILSRDYVDKKAKKVAEERGVHFLDEADFFGVGEKLLKFVQDGKTTVVELLKFTMDEAKISDETTAVAWLKNFVVQHKSIYTKGGLVWKR